MCARSGASDYSGNFGGTRWPLTPMRRPVEDSIGWRAGLTAVDDPSVMTEVQRLALIRARPSIAQNFLRGSGYSGCCDVVPGRATRPSSRRPSASVASRNGITK
jgi:hypothetical protein